MDKSQPFELDRYARVVLAAWPDVMLKAKRLITDGRVTLHRNGYNNVVATVIGDHGVYNVEVGRDDPNSRAISTWTCECQWDQYAWGRTRQWKKYEGRPCSHVLAMYWKALGTPLDEDAIGQQSTPGQKQPVDPMADQGQLFEAPAQAGPPAISMKDLTIPGSPSMPAQKEPGEPSQIDPSINRPMFMPPTDPKQQRLFGLPGALSHVYSHMSNIDTIPIRYERVAADRSQTDLVRIKELIGEGRTPVVQAIAPIMGEYSGGKIPVPGAEPYDIHDDGYPLHHWRDLGWDPTTGMQADPPSSGPGETGRFGEIPEGARMEVWGVDGATDWVQVAYSTGFGKLQHHLIRAWTDMSTIRLIPDQKTPFVHRR